MKMIFDEWYGTISHAQRAAYRKHNISPSDHDMLVLRFGETNHATITKYVNDNNGRIPFGWC